MIMLKQEGFEAQKHATSPEWAGFFDVFANTVFQRCVKS